jgi:uroporphyrin-III C-methyltransferase
VAIISKATTAEQTVLETTLEHAAADAKRAGIEPPALVAVGPAVRLRRELDWLGAAAASTLERAR